MLLSLNDDCLGFVIEKLQVFDQMRMIRVCRRLRVIVEQIWRHSSRISKITICTINIDHVEYEKYLPDYLFCISKEVKVLKFYSASLLTKANLSHIQFPKVHKLFLTGFDFPLDGDVRDIKLVLQNFPNLISLTISSDITRLNVCLIKNVQDLDLSDCCSLHPEDLKEIFLGLNLKKVRLYFGEVGFYNEGIEWITECKTLEEICIDESYLEMIYDSLFEFKNLRKIAFYTFDKEVTRRLLKTIAIQYGNVIETAIFHTGYRCVYYFPYLNGMVKLRRFTLSLLPDKQFELSKFLANTLEEFIVTALTVPFEGLLRLLDVIRHCTNLKLLDLSNSDISVYFVEQVAKIIEKQRGKRIQTLLLRFNNTKKNNMLLKNLKLPTGMEISLGKQEIELLCYSMEFEWQCFSVEDSFLKEGI